MPTNENAPCWKMTKTTSQSEVSVLKLFQSNGFVLKMQSGGSIRWLRGANDNCSCWKCRQNSTCWKCRQQQHVLKMSIVKKTARAENDGMSFSAHSGILGHDPYSFNPSKWVDGRTHQARSSSRPRNRLENAWCWRTLACMKTLITFTITS